MMTRIYVPTRGPADWQRLLAEPEKQWKQQYSARTLAHAWEAEPGRLPAEIVEALDRAGDDALHRLEMLLAIPEHQVPLDGGGRPSQNDVFVLARNDHGLVAMTVEGKVGEPFGPTLGEWLVDASGGKLARLSALGATLGLVVETISHEVRYQLLHRAASALIEARRFHAATAVMVVHSYSAEWRWFDDYSAFVRLFQPLYRPTRPVTEVVRLGTSNGIGLSSVWVHGDQKFLTA